MLIPTIITITIFITNIVVIQTLLMIMLIWREEDWLRKELMRMRNVIGGMLLMMINGNYLISR